MGMFNNNENKKGKKVSKKSEVVPPVEDTNAPVIGDAVVEPEAKELEVEEPAEAKESKVIEPEAGDIVGEAKSGEASGAEKLMKLNKADLSELAQRNGFTDEITNEVTKAMLAAFIISRK